MLREPIGAAREPSEIHTDGGEGRAELDAPAGERRVQRQDADGLASRPQPADGIFHCRHDRRMIWLADVTETRNKVGRTDEDPIDARDGGDRLKLFERLGGLHLHEQAELPIRLGSVTRHPSGSIRHASPWDG